MDGNQKMNNIRGSLDKSDEEEGEGGRVEKILKKSWASLTDGSFGGISHPWKNILAL